LDCRANGLPVVERASGRPLPPAYDFAAVDVNPRAAPPNGSRPARGKPGTGGFWSRTPGKSRAASNG